jgi:hypothetical protein
MLLETHIEPCFLSPSFVPLVPLLGDGISPGLFFGPLLVAKDYPSQSPLRETKSKLASLILNQTQWIQNCSARIAKSGQKRGFGDPL